MKKQIFFLLVFITILGIASPIPAAGAPPAKGDPMPALTLPVPKSPDEKAYLGLTGDGTFKLSQIKAQVVIIEIFSMYCPFCQVEAPTVNELYRLIEENPELKGKIKLLGLGAGNSIFEVNVFKNKYQIPFPLLPDQDFTFHKALGEVRTPYFIALKFKKDRSPQVIFSELGTIHGARPFLEKIISLSELK
jgi:peroxiredoxin